MCCASVRRSFEAVATAAPVGTGTGGDGDGTGGDGDGVTDAVAAVDVGVAVGVAVAETVGSGDGVEVDGGEEGLLGVHPSPAAPARSANISTLRQLPGAGLISTSL